MKKMDSILPPPLPNKNKNENENENENENKNENKNKNNGWCIHFFHGFNFFTNSSTPT